MAKATLAGMAAEISHDNVIVDAARDDGEIAPIPESLAQYRLRTCSNPFRILRGERSPVTA
ncbi:MAG TPA: hypothetical protein VF509_02925 [Sphingobium sp.]